MLRSLSFKVLKTKNKLLNSNARPFMSEAYHCQDAWDKRLNHQIMKKVNLSNMFHDIDSKLNQIGKVSAIDVDIFTNLVNDDFHLEDMEDVVHRFRLTSEAMKMLDSTPHAFIRAFMSYGDRDELLRILNDRLNYGIFPDDYCNILMMDSFIKENNFTNAAKVATIEMLQENFSNPLVNYFSLYSCHKYLLEPGIWNKSEKVNEEVNIEDDDEAEVTKVRVPYLRNPYFDDHFDLTDPYSLIGKTFKLIGETGVDPLSNSYRLIGLVLYKKWNDAAVFSNNMLAKLENINSGCVDVIEKFLISLPKEEGEKGNEIQEQISVIQTTLQKMKNNNLVLEKDLLLATEEKLNLKIQEEEKTIIKEQCQTYDKWETKREEVLLDEIEEMRRQQRIETVNLKKEEMAAKEQELFFFDLEEKLDLEIESKFENTPTPTEEEKKGTKKRDDSDYIPPEIIKKRAR